jgi:octaprenyl-diphosphate synthase
MTAGTVPVLQALFAPIQSDLERVETEIGRMLATEAEPLERLIGHVSRFSGKRLRPALTLMAGRICGGLNQDHYPVSAIVELIHTATLVHDDILDESAMRRRVETVNHRIGNETAVLLGDYIFSTAFKEAAALEDPFASRYLAEIVGVVCRGEILQVHHRNDFDLDEPTYFRIIEDKTASLYAASLRCGAVLSGAPDAHADALHDFGLKMGCAFQIVDDILDLTGEESAVGKSLGTDIDKSKMTLPLLHLRDRASKSDRERLRAIVVTHDEEQRIGLHELLAEYGAVESARATAHELVAQARARLEELPACFERDLLRRAAEFVLARDR